jgi:prepilin-type N-terminal cleavage/methylation domain-containing protein
MSFFVTKSKKGFTLLEVVIALAVFAFLIGGLLGFLPWSVEGVSKVREQDTAYGLVDGVQTELERMGFSMVEAGTNRLAGLYSSFDSPRESGTQFDLLLVARKEGGAVAFEQVVENSSPALLNGDQLEEGPNQELLSKEMGGVVYFNQTTEQDPVSLYGFDDSHKEIYPTSTRWIPEEDRYYLIKCSQFPFEHRHQHHPSNGFLALQVDIQWPYKVPDPSSEEGYRRVPMKFRNHFRLPMAVAR